MEGRGVLGKGVKENAKKGLTAELAEASRANGEDLRGAV